MPLKPTTAQALYLIDAWPHAKSKENLAKHFQISRNTLYRWAHYLGIDIIKEPDPVIEAEKIKRWVKGNNADNQFIGPSLARPSYFREDLTNLLAAGRTTPLNGYYSGPKS